MTMNDIQTPDEIETLLPWHAAGTLKRADAQKVEAALARDPELARRFDLVREELGDTILLNETLGAPSARARDKLFAAIEAEAPVARARSLGIGAMFTQFFASLQPRTLAFAGTAAALLILVQAAVITGGVLQQRDAGTQLASSRLTVPGSGPTVLVRFAPQARAEDILRFLETYKATLVEGPRAGMFKLRVAGADDTQALATVASRMQNDKTVVTFAAVSE
jgi:hypothetical protein